MRLENRAALITGGTSGIGEATAQLFAEEGAKLAIVGRNAERGEAIADRIRSSYGGAIFVQADVRRADECRNAVDRTTSEFGRLDVLFNNAGTYVANDTVGCSEEEWDDQVDTSLKGTFLMSKFALPQHRSTRVPARSSTAPRAGGSSAVPGPSRTAPRREAWSS